MISYRIAKLIIIMVFINYEIFFYHCTQKLFQTKPDMKNFYSLIPATMLIMLVALSCNNRISNPGEQAAGTTAVASAGPDAIIYKTRADYNMLVPVTLNEDKTTIVSYPAPKDLYYRGNPSLPTVLENGFLLDNRGINANVAFISLTYEEYMALEKAPEIKELLDLIVDRDPLLEMYRCGKRQSYRNEVDELNAYILEGNFSKFEKLK